MDTDTEGFKAAWFEIVAALGLGGGAEKLGISNAQYHASVVMPKIAELMMEKSSLIQTQADIHAIEHAVTMLSDIHGDHVTAESLLRVARRLRPTVDEAMVERALAAFYGRQWSVIKNADEPPKWMRAALTAALTTSPEADAVKPDAPKPFTDDQPFDHGSLTIGAAEREQKKRFEELIALTDDDENHAAGLVLVAEMVGLELPCSMADIAREIARLKAPRRIRAFQQRGGMGVDD